MNLKANRFAKFENKNGKLFCIIKFTLKNPASVMVAVFMQPQVENVQKL